MTIGVSNIVNLLISLCLVQIFTSNFILAEVSECRLIHQMKEHPAFARLRKLSGKRYSITDDLQQYTYNVGICTDAEPSSQPNVHAGIVQRNLKSPMTDVSVVGMYTKANFMAGNNWMLLEYLEGDKYSGLCGDQPRRGSIMFMCDPNETQGSLHLIEENTNKSSECYYLFELTHADVCSGAVQSSQGLSAGSVVVIVFFTLLGVYLIGGFLYQRFVAGAKGWEQIPNHAFWQDFGNLLADGCEMVCRSGPSTRSTPTTMSREYTGLGDDQLQDEEFDRDEHLLPM